jgi:hypothetical protein
MDFINIHVSHAVLTWTPGPQGQTFFLLLDCNATDKQFFPEGGKKRLNELIL